MPNMAALTSATTLTTISSSAYNTNLTTIRDWANTSAVMKDVAATISVGHTFTATQTFTPGSGAAFTVTTGGITITAGGITVSAGGVTVTGNSTITGTLNVTSTLSQGGVAVVTGTGTSGRMTRWTGTGVVANSAASDDGTVITNATQPCFRATSDAAGATADASAHTFVWNAASMLNVGSMWDAGQTTRITGAVAGTYLAVAAVKLTFTGTYSLTWQVNGVNTAQLSSLTAASGGTITLPVIAQLTAGQYLTLVLTNSTGGSISGMIATASAAKLW